MKRKVLVTDKSTDKGVSQTFSGETSSPCPNKLARLIKPKEVRNAMMRCEIH